MLLKRLMTYYPPEALFDSFHEASPAVFLDSTLVNDLGRYSILGLFPYGRVEAREGRVWCNGQMQEGTLEEALKAMLSDCVLTEPIEFDLPLIGGALGYCSYDYGRGYEHIESRHETKVVMPEALWLFPDVLVIDDLLQQTTTIIAHGRTNDAETLTNRVIERLQQWSPRSMPIRQNRKADFIADTSADEYKAAVKRLIDYIVEGDVYIANYTQQLHIQSEKEPAEMYRYLRHYNPAPFAAYIKDDQYCIISASPERFLEVRQGMVSTRPIKGTRPRGSTPEEDAFYLKALQESEKDRSELLMIVDLERNDISRVCELHSVEVVNPFEVEAYATVFHLVSTIQGRLRAPYTAVDLLPAAFPGGSITGAPKIRAMQIIDELEQGKRGLYTGSIGYFSANGDCDLNIVIRTAVWQQGVYHIGVGGGITCESDPVFEYEEMLQKAKALLEALGGEET